MQRNVGKILFAVAVAVMLIIVGALSYFYVNGGQTPYSGTEDDVLDTGTNPPAATVDLAPDFNYQTINGDYISLSGLRGNVIILDFMAMWCQPCGAQMTYLNQIHEKYSSRGVTIISIDVDLSETRDNLLLYKAEKGAAWHFAFDADGIASNPKYAASSIPTLAIIDKDGALANRYVGVTNYETLSAAVDRLL